MHAKIYQAFETICLERNLGESVLEVGAVPGDTSLLAMESLKNVKEKIGINIDGPYLYNDFKIVQGNANRMTFFQDSQFDTVLCNAVIEHDKFFWKTIEEMKRVLKPGGLLVIGAVGYTTLRIEKYIQFVSSQLIRISRYFDRWCFHNATLTFRIHNFPGDYYRFSPQAFKEVLFEGMHDVRMSSLMLPPRIIGSGIKP